MDLKTGIKKSNEYMVTFTETANTVGSGSLQVLATPVMMGWMENASMLLVQPYLDEGCTTVGTAVNIKHIAATPVSMKVKIEAELIEVDGRKLLFNVTAYDEIEKVGEGTHERFIIFEDKFMQKADKKNLAK